MFKVDRKCYREVWMIKVLKGVDIEEVVFGGRVKFVKELNCDKGLRGEGMEMVKEIKEGYEK